VISQVENRAGALTAQALVRPFVSFSSLGVVGIVVAPPGHNPRFSVLPPAPPAPKKAHPVPTVTVTVTPGQTTSPSPSPSASAGG
jgi:rod shape-determining protein MreC